MSFRGFSAALRQVIFLSVSSAKVGSARPKGFATSPPIICQWSTIHPSRSTFPCPSRTHQRYAPVQKITSKARCVVVNCWSWHPPGQRRRRLANSALSLDQPRPVSLCRGPVAHGRDTIRTSPSGWLSCGDRRAIIGCGLSRYDLRDQSHFHCTRDSALCQDPCMAAVLERVILKERGCGSMRSWSPTKSEAEP